MKRQVADRIFMTLISVTVVTISQLEPRSLSFQMVKAGGFPAKVCMLFLFVMAIVALLDTVVNDMLPEAYVLRGPLGRRRGIWSSLSITYMGIAFVANKEDLGWAVAIFYVLFSIRCAGVAWLDLYYEYEPVVKDPATPISSTISGALSDE